MFVRVAKKVSYWLLLLGVCFFVLSLYGYVEMRGRSVVFIVTADTSYPPPLPHPSFPGCRGLKWTSVWLGRLPSMSNKEREVIYLFGNTAYWVAIVKTLIPFNISVYLRNPTPPLYIYIILYPYLLCIYPRLLYTSPRKSLRSTDICPKWYCFTTLSNYCLLFSP